MNVEYKQLNTIEHFKECEKLQKEIFGLSDIEIISSTLLKVIARKDHELGILTGCFLNKEDSKKMIGLSIGIANLKKDSVYNLLIGVLPEYQNKVYGIHLGLKHREFILDKGLKYMYTSYDPMKLNLAKLYFGYGMQGIQFIKNEFEYSDNEILTKMRIPSDKILLVWDLLSDNVINKINKTYKSLRMEDVIKQFPVIDKNNKLYKNKVLIEIPVLNKTNDNKLELKYRHEVRELLDEYININNYIITDFYSGKIAKKRKSYYLLEKIALN